MTASPILAILQGVTYPGGKNGAGVFQRIISQIPPHDIYIEPFAGGAAILRLKRPARLNIAVDLDTSALWALQAWFRDPLARNGDGPGGEGDISVTGSVKFIHSDGIAFLESFRFSGSEVVYCDPPYLHSTRSRPDMYGRFEMSDAQHVHLLEVIRRLPCSVLISGYHSELYSSALRGWRSIDFQTVNRAGRPTREWVWSNFPEPVVLHDYRYLGEGFRERERIKRKKQRWVARLDRMPVLERQALLWAIATHAAAPQK